MLPAKTAMLPLFLSFLFFNLYPAFAASGGRMGGDAFDSKRSSSPPPPSSDFYTPSRYDHHYNYHQQHFHHLDQNQCVSPSPESDSSTLGGIIATVGFAGAVSVVVYLSFLENRCTLVMVQVGLSGKARKLQRELNEIARTSDSSSSQGWHHILTETTLALLRHPDFFISAYSSAKRTWSIKSVEKSFKEMSTEEREKFHIESLVNVNNVIRQREVVPEASKGKDYIVVTILVAAQGSYKVPIIRSTDDVKDALRSLNIASSKLLAVEVLWTPQDENETLPEDELLQNYPVLRPI